MEILMWLTGFLEHAMLWLVHWAGSGLVMLQIYSDTGYWWTRQETMSYQMQNLHDRLTAWILKDNKKEK
jgi:hypothetical protein